MKCKEGFLVLFKIPKGHKYGNRKLGGRLRGEHKNGEEGGKLKSFPSDSAGNHNLLSASRGTHMDYWSIKVNIVYLVWQQLS